MYDLCTLADPCVGPDSNCSVTQQGEVTCACGSGEYSVILIYKTMVIKLLILKSLTVLYTCISRDLYFIGKTVFTKSMLPPDNTILNSTFKNQNVQI